MKETRAFYILLACRVYVVVALALAAAFAPLAYMIIPLTVLIAHLYIEFRAGQTSFRLPFTLFLALALPLLLAFLVGPWASPALTLPVLPLLDAALRSAAARTAIMKIAHQDGHLQQLQLWGSKQIAVAPEAAAHHNVSIRSPRFQGADSHGQKESALETTGPGSSLTGAGGDGAGSARPHPTPLLLSLFFSLLIAGLLATVFTNWTLLITLAVPAVYLAAVTLRVRLSLRTVPIVSKVISHKVVAGDSTVASIKMASHSEIGGRVALFPRHDWFHVSPTTLSLRGVPGDAAIPPVEVHDYEVGATFAAPLAGQASVGATAAYLDPWGLMRADFDLEMLRLFIIPRAKYAEWLARKYLEMSRGGMAEAMSAVRPPQRASRSGLEFYGLRSYEPGDSSRAIDWKHTFKLNEVIVKEFQGTGVECAILLTNLAVANEAEKDILVSNLIMTALTMARENIPCAHAAYHEQDVVVATPLLGARQSLVQALNLSRAVTVFVNPVRYRQVADIARIRSDIHRLRESASGPAGKLADLLQVEYQGLSKSAAGNPAMRALNTALNIVVSRPNIIMLSGRNHDAASLAIAQYSMKARGYRVLSVDMNSRNSRTQRTVVTL